MSTLSRSSSLYDAALASSCVHPPLTLPHLLQHPRGFALCLEFLKKTPHLSALYFWSDLHRLNGDVSSLSRPERNRLEQSVIGRLRASLIRKHAAISRAVREKSQIGNPRVTSEKQEQMKKLQNNAIKEEEAVSDDEDEYLANHDGINSNDADSSHHKAEEAEAMREAAAEFLRLPATSPNRPSPSTSDTDLLLDVIKLQFVDHNFSSSATSAATATSVTSATSSTATSSSSSTNSSSAASSLPATLSALLSHNEEGEEFALHSYASAITNHLMQRLPQLQSALEKLIADRYWDTIKSSKQYEALCKAPPPTVQEIKDTNTNNDISSDSNESVPSFNLHQTKLVVTYLYKPEETRQLSASNPNQSPVPNTPSATTPGGATGSGSTLAPPTSAGAASSSSTTSSSSSSVTHPYWKRRTVYFDEHPSGVLIIGRSEHVDISVTDSGVSRTHGKLTWTPLSNDDNSSNTSSNNPSKDNPVPALTYQDLGSTYGSKLNGESVQNARLQVGSVLGLGKNVMLRVLKIDERDREKRERRRLNRQQQQHPHRPQTTARTSASNANASTKKSSDSKCCIS